MRIYFKRLGGHIHCRVFTTGSKCGDLCFTVREWTYVQTHFNAVSVTFIDETPAGERSATDSLPNEFVTPVEPPE